MPMVIRIPFGGGIGAVEHHSESPEAQFAHTPGLKVVACCNPVDAYWMIQQAIASDDPVIFFEPKRRYHEKAELDESAPPALPLHQAKVVREGTDATLFCLRPDGEDLRCRPPRPRSRTAGTLEVVDLRTLSPLDLATIFASVKKTRRAVVVHEAPSRSAWVPRSRRGSPRSASTPSRRRCCASAGTTRPTRRRGSEEDYLPDLDRVLDGVDRVMGY